MMRSATREAGWGRTVIKRIGPRALLSWGLLLVVMVSITTGLIEASPNLDVAFVLVVTVVAVSFGWLLALLPMSGGLAALFGLVFGLEYLLVRVGRLGDELLEIGEAIGRVIWDTAIWYWTEQPPDLGPVAQLYLSLWQDVGTLLARTGNWLVDVVSGVGSFDVVGAAIVWGLVIWAYSMWAGFLVRRGQRTLLGVLPGSVLMSFAVSYTRANPYIFLPVVGGSLVLMATGGQRVRESRWQALGVDFSQGLWGDVIATATGISVALVVVAAIAPSVSYQKIADWVDEITGPEAEQRTEAVAEGLGLEQQPEPVPPRPLESARVTSLPQRHLIGSGPELSRRVVMIVETGELPPLPPEEMMQLQESAPRHYWRSLTYDRYFGRGWATSSTETAIYEPGEPTREIDTEPEYVRTLRQQVRLIGEGPTGVVFVDGTLVSVDQPFEVLWRPTGEIFAATTTERQYTADSVYLSPTVEELTESSTDYPEWVTDRYLRLPESTPERVLALSRDLTATEPTPYERAVAIETYLREFPYNLDVPAPGASDDIADFFLFELQEGYCDYYATAMVVLARAAGLPSRLVIGYVSGTYDPVNARYVVTEADAHAWPEIYFPGYGWIEFEPTGGRAPIRRRAEQEEFAWQSSDTTQPLVPTEPTDSGPARILVVGQWVLLVAGGLLTIFGLATGIEVALLAVGSTQGMLSRLQRRLQRYARRLRVPQHRGDTPAELSRALGTRLGAIAAAHGFVGIEFVEPGIEEVDEITELYALAWYSPAGSISSKDRRRAIWLWWRLRWRFWLAWLWRRSGRRAEGAPAAGVDAAAASTSAASA